MNRPATPRRWFSTWRATRAVPSEPADLGTAFGLDLSLEDAPAAKPAAARTAGWMRRLTTRRRAA